MSKQGSSNSNLLAVFWYIDGEFYGMEDTRDGGAVENYGGVLQLGYDHYSIWDSVSPYAGTYEYDDFPRGRILWVTNIHKFRVVGSKAIVENPNVQVKVRNFYGLPITTEFVWDEHYR